MAESVRRLFGAGTVAGLDESRLLDRFADGGDPAAFEAIVGRHGPMVLGVARRILDDPNDVDDAFQATFLLLVRKARSIRDRDELGSWLHGVARRVATRARVASRRRRVRERAWVDRSGDSEAAGSGAEALELRAIVDAELARLPERYRSPMVLCDLEGQTHEHAAEQLRCPVGTIKSRLSRGRDRLRSRLERRGLGPVAGLFAPPTVPEALMARTVRGAVGWINGGRAVAAGASSAGVLAMMKGGVSAMRYSPIKLAAIVAIAVGLAASGSFAFLRQATAPAAREAQSSPPAPRPGRAEAVEPRAPASDPKVERMVLDNGLTVLLRPIAGAKETDLVVLYSVGGDHDPVGKSGLAHLAEHVYLTAAAGKEKARTSEEFHRRYPAGANGQTGDRYTMFVTGFAPKELDGELRDASARMGDLRVTPADLDRERPRVLEELANMYGNFPALAALNNAREWVRPSPAGPRRGGSEVALMGFRALDVQEHLGRYYGPKNAIVALAGDFDPAEAARLIRAHFGSLPPGQKAPAPRPPGRMTFVAEEIVATAPDQDGPPMACLAYLAPSPGDELYAPFLVLIARLWADADKLGGDGNGFPVYFTPMDDGAIVAVSTPARSGEGSKEAFARLEAFVAETVGPKLRADEPSETLQTIGSFFQTVPVADAMLKANPYGVAFALGRREQMGIDPARFNRSIAAVTEPALRRAALEIFARTKHAGAFVKLP